MKKTYSYFIIHRYERRIALKSKVAVALFITALMHFSVKANPLNTQASQPAKKTVTQPLAEPAAADIKVSGTITDATGATLPGASISLKNGKALAVTDVNGRFTVTVA